MTNLGNGYAVSTVRDADGRTLILNIWKLDHRCRTDWRLVGLVMPDRSK